MASTWAASRRIRHLTRFRRGSPAGAEAESRGRWLQIPAMAADLWSLRLINTDDQSEYLQAFSKNLQFASDMDIECIRVDTVQPPTIFAEVPRQLPAIGW